MSSDSPRWLCCVALASTLACSDRSGSTTGEGDAGGTVVIVEPGAEPSPLLPALADDQVSRLVTDQLYDRLAEIGPSLNTVGDAGFQPRLARSWTWSSDSMSVAFAIDPAARWHDGQPVRASDVAFTFALDRDPRTATQLTATLGNVDSITVRDSLTAVAWFHRRSPEQFYELVYNMFVMPEHVLRDTPREALRTSDVVRRPIGSGRFRFVQWVPGQRIEIVADTANYRGRAKLDRVIVSFVTEGGAAVAQLLSGQADFYESLPPSVLPTVDSSDKVRTIRYPGQGIAYMGMNNRAPRGRAGPHPVFGDRTVRRAVSMAVDRRAMLRNVFDTLGVLGCGPYACTFMDTTVTMLPFDRARAAALLDSAGWRAGPNGVRAKNGRPLAFTLLVPTSSTFRMRYATLLQEQLNNVGARVEIEPADISAFIARLEARDFDAAIMATGPDPARSGVKQNWATEGIARGGQNQVSYSSGAFDALIDSAVTSFDKGRADMYFHRAMQTLIDDAPAVWLYDILNLAGVHQRLRVTGLRADTWWAALADWTIPANERIDRDRIGLRSARQ